MRIVRTLRLVCTATLATAFFAGLLVSPAAARRGISQAQIKAYQKQVQQQQQMNQGLSKVQADRDKETMSKYDLNGNGKIDGSEKPAWDRFWPPWLRQNQLPRIQSQGRTRPAHLSKLTSSFR